MNNLWKTYLSPTPANVAKAMIGIKTVLVSIAGAEMFSGNPKAGFWILLATGVLNEIANFLTTNKDGKDTDNNG